MTLDPLRDALCSVAHISANKTATGFALNPRFFAWAKQNVIINPQHLLFQNCKASTTVVVNN
jgi:hypothetical protein